MELNLPFSSIPDAELCWLLQNDCSNDLLHNDILTDYLDKNQVLLGELDFQYVTESQFNSVLGSYNKNSSGDEIANVNFFYNIAHVEASDYAH